MNTKVFSYFLAVAEEGNVTRAADRLGVTQPALTQQLKKLEHDLRATLFERTSTGVVLTSSGEALVPHAKRILQELREVRVHIDELNGFRRGQLSVGLVQTVNLQLMPLVMARFRERFPGVALTLREFASHQVDPNLASGRLDVGVGILWGGREQSEFVTEALFEEELVLAVPEGHALWGRREVEVRELEGTSLINVVPGSKRAWDASCDEAGVRTHVVAEMSSVASAVASAGYMRAAAVIPALGLVNAPVERVRGVKLVNPTPVRTVGCLWRRKQYRSALSSTLSAMLREAAVSLSSPFLRPL